MTDINDLKKQLKVEWSVLKDKTASAQDKASAKTEINRLEKEAGFKVTDFAANDAAFAARKQAGTSSASTVAAKFVPLATFTELDANQQAQVKKYARKLFEKKNLIEQVASEEFPQYNNGASVGQVLGIISEQ